MTDKPAVPEISNVAALNRPEADTEPLPTHSDQCSQVLLESFLGNPRFSVPANDETATLKAAPVHQDCRDAKLLSMWIEVLIEEELNSK